MKKKTIAAFLVLTVLNSISGSVMASEVNRNPEEALSQTEPLPEAQDDSDPESQESDSLNNLESQDKPVEETTSDTDKETPSSITISATPGEKLDLEEITSTYLGVTPESITPSILDEVVSEESFGLKELHYTVLNEHGEIQNETLYLTITGKPVISIENPSLSVGEKFTLEALNVTAVDHEDGELTHKIEISQSDVPVDEIIEATEDDSFQLTLSVTDSEGNTTVEESHITLQNETIAPQEVLMNDLNASSSTTIAGEDRLRTSIAISQKMYEQTDVVILVDAMNFPDALSAGPLAAEFDAPILLTYSKSLPSYTEAEIERLGATKVILMGGEVAISADIENQLKLKKLTVERIAGDTRFTTAIAAAEKLGTSSKIILADGMNFADAMTAGSYAAMNSLPILLTLNSSVPEAVQEFLDGTVQEVLVMGGEVAISEKVVNDLKSSGIQVTRIAGINRFDTSVEMAEQYFSGRTSAVVANGMNFADALAAVPYASAMGLPILLTFQHIVEDNVLDYIVNHKISSFHFVGGEVALSDYVKSSMEVPYTSDLEYRTAGIDGIWSTMVKNGQTSGNISASGISSISIQPAGNEDLSARYGVSIVGQGWQKIVEDGSAGIKGNAINGLVMELKGDDAAENNLYYRVYVKDTGWSEWTSGGTALGGPEAKPILAVEAKIIKGNALNITNVFPSRPLEKNYAYTKTSVRLRSGEGISYDEIFMLQAKSYVELISTNPETNWSKVKYTARGETYIGYISSAYLTVENHVSKTILTLEGIKDGEGLPESTVEIFGDIAHKSGISSLKYYVNGAFVDTIDYGYLSDRSLALGFDEPAQTGYSFSVTPDQWMKNRINTLKVEMTAKDGTIEWETIHLNDTKDILKIEEQGASFNYYVDTEYNRGAAVISLNGKWQPASRSQIAYYMNPERWISHDIYKYMFLDLNYSPDDYTVTAAQLDDIIAGKGVLDGMGSVFLKAATDFNINPFYLVSHAILESGHGTSVLANGQQLEFYHAKHGTISSELIPLSEEDKAKTWYNVFGIGANDDNPNLWGAERAYDEGWDSVEDAIYGGAKWITNGYIDRMPDSQNTNYKMRYNLRETMSHQYATDIMWAYSQALRIKIQMDSLETDIPLTFVIPSFSNVRP